MAISVGVANKVSEKGLFRFGIPEEYLTRLARGELIGAIAETEPYVGSDAAAVEVTAELHEDKYVLNGKKKFITQAGIADVYVVYCLTDDSPGARAKQKHMSAFLVKRGTQGLTNEKIHELMMWKSGMYNGILDFDNVRVRACRVYWENVASLSIPCQVSNKIS